MTKSRRLLLAIVASILVTGEGFQVSLLFSTCGRTENRLELAKASSSLAESEEEIKQLIISLSKEGTDDSRRERLRQLFNRAMKDDAAQKFTQLFERTLISVGDEIRQSAIEEEEEAAKGQLSSSSDKADDSTEEMVSTKKQVWALVDMMVQSKTIVKRAKDGFE